MDVARRSFLAAVFSRPATGVLIQPAEVSAGMTCKILFFHQRSSIRMTPAFGHRGSWCLGKARLAVILVVGATYFWPCYGRNHGPNPANHHVERKNIVDGLRGAACSNDFSFDVDVVLGASRDHVDTRRAGSSARLGSRGLQPCGRYRFIRVAQKE